MSDLQKQLKQQQAALDELVKARGDVEKERAGLQAEAQKSLAGVALDALRGKARTQAEKAAEAAGLTATIAELERRIATQRGEIADTERAIALARADELQAEAAAISGDLAALAPDLQMKAARLGEIRRELVDLMTANGEKHAGLSVGGKMARQLDAIQQAVGAFSNGQG